MRTQRHLVTFEAIAELDAVVMAKLGIGNRAIVEETGLTSNQVTYRLHKAKTLQGYANGHTYRSEWRSGTGEAVRDVLRALRPSMMKESKRILTPLVEHPTPEISKHK